nr:acyl-CoA dehydrogenase [Amycolatopsis dendrobii]
MDGARAPASFRTCRTTSTITSVAGALEADVFLVAAGGALYEVAAAGATVTPVGSLDMTRQLADVRLDAAPGRLVLSDCSLAIRRALECGAGLLAAEQVGVARWCLETTVEYLKMRRQFGRVVGGFQALKHRLVDLYTSVESAAAAAQYAAAPLATGETRTCRSRWPSHRPTAATSPWWPRRKPLNCAAVSG